MGSQSSATAEVEQAASLLGGKGFRTGKLPVPLKTPLPIPNSVCSLQSDVRDEPVPEAGTLHRDTAKYRRSCYGLLTGESAFHRCSSCLSRA